MALGHGLPVGTVYAFYLPPLEVDSFEPFSQGDWPNPNLPQRNPSQVGFVDQSIWNFVVPFSQTDWPNPKGRPPLPVDYIDPSETWLFATSLPFSQDDWPNPRGPQSAVGVFRAGTTPLLLSGQAPFSQTYWPNPQSRPTTPIVFSDTYNRPVIVGNPFYQTDWQNPRGAAGILVGTIDQSIWNLTIPFNQTDWPNPQIRRYDGLAGHLDGVIFGIEPFSQQEWPNPRGPKPLAVSWTDNYNRPVVVGIPFSQTNWPNPQGRAGLLTGWIDTYNRTVVTVSAPFNQQDWPNPGRVYSPQLGWIDNYSIRNLVPFAQVNWPNPRGNVIYPLYWADTGHNFYTQVIGNPFYQGDWPNPKGYQPLNVAPLVPYPKVYIIEPTPPPPDEVIHNLPFLVTMGKLKSF